MKILYKYLVIFLTVIFWLFVSCDNDSDKKEKYQKNLKNYLNNTFKIQIDTLDTKLVLVNYIGCKPCVNKSLKFLAETGRRKPQFVFIVPGGKKKEFNKYYRSSESLGDYKEKMMSDKSLTVYIDSDNAIYNQDLGVNGLSVYDINNGKIKKIKTIDINKLAKKELEHFWFDWK